MAHLIFFLAVVCVGVYSHPPAEEMTIDQAIQESATSSKSMEFLQDNSTLMVELDMKMSPDDWEEYNSAGRSKRKAIRDKRWPNGVVTYDRIPFASNEIRSAFAEYHRYTCIKFQQGNARGSIYFQNGGGCSSYVGRLGNRQPVTLAPGCRRKGIIIHELGHAVGLHHEQTRQDRDNYVTINFQNIHSNMAFNFRQNDVYNMGVPYSYTSVMHYGQRAFSKNGGITIVAKQRQYQHIMGQQSGFDFADIKILNLMYKCGGHCGAKSCPHPGFVGKDCRCWCPGNPVKECSGGRSRLSGKSCSNSHPNDSECELWSQAGNCTGERYGHLMSEICQKSCGMCGSTLLSKVEDDCVDNFEKCALWAMKGECKTNVVYMNDYCKKSCDSCNKDMSYITSVKCENVNSACETWAKQGMCEQNIGYMKQTCPKSCHPKCRHI